MQVAPRPSPFMPAPPLPNSGRVVEVDPDVAAHEQVEVSVPVVVREAAARRPAAALHAGLLGDVREGPSLVVAVERVAPEAGDVDVLPAVPVEVGGADAHGPARVADARLVRHVLELHVPEVAVERAASGIGVVGRVHGEGVGEVDVEEPVVVVVEERDPAAHRLHDVLLLGRGLVLDAIPASSVTSRKRRRAPPAPGCCAAPGVPRRARVRQERGAPHRDIPPVENPVSARTSSRRDSASSRTATVEREVLLRARRVVEARVGQAELVVGLRRAGRGSHRLQQRVARFRVPFLLHPHHPHDLVRRRVATRRSSALRAWVSASWSSPRPSSASASAARASTLSGARLRARRRGGLASE